ncbi:MAG: phosphoglucosamine mutase [Bacteroidetes bacterium]|nr:phosphoglucosamine mutase [Bacteroidota bacterium]
MSLIKSISGIRGTLGGKPGEGLTPQDVVLFVSAYATFIKLRSKKEIIHIVIGRDARISGPMVSQLVAGTLNGMGADVTDIELSTTPTVEMAVTGFGADGGIIITASHNPGNWNALKLLNSDGEFLNDEEGKEILRLAEKGEFLYSEVENLGTYTTNSHFIDYHIAQVLAMPLVDVKAISAAGFKVAIDCVNSTGGLVLPSLLKALGVKEVVEIFCEPDGRFPHNPEPLPDNLRDLSAAVVQSKAQLGFAVDPDVDRLAIINEDGSMFGEEYTLVAVSDYVLKSKKGNTVSNLSSTRALRDVTEKAGGSYSAAAVGEVNVVSRMKETNAVIGGEGNGGVIYPPLHYGRDALAGIALFLSHLAKSGLSCSQLRATYPEYVISKNKIALDPSMDVDKILEVMAAKYRDQPVNTFDGVKIEFDKEWVHLRKSNTEPIIRIYSESHDELRANALANKIMDDIRAIAAS